MNNKFAFLVVIMALNFDGLAHAEPAKCSQAASVETETGHSSFVINDAKIAAISYLKANPPAGLAGDEKINFQKSLSSETTIDSLEQQINLNGPNNSTNPILQGFVTDLKQDSSLQIFTIFLATVKASDRYSQTMLTVKLRRSNGATVFEVSPYFM